MKIALFFIICLLLPTLLRSEEELTKVYIEPSQIAFVDQAIFAYIEGDWIHVEELHYSAHGGCIAYAKKIHPARWVCRVCHYNNYAGDSTCQRRDEVNNCLCGAPRPW